MMGVMKRVQRICCLVSGHNCKSEIVGVHDLRDIALDAGEELCYNSHCWIPPLLNDPDSD